MATTPPKIVGGRFLKYDVTDWPLIIASVHPLPYKQNPSLDDIQDARRSMCQVMHVAKYGSNNSSPLSGFVVDSRAAEMAQGLPEELMGLPPGPVTKVVDLSKAYLPSWERSMDLLDLVRLSETEQHGCLANRYIVLPPVLQPFLEFTKNHMSTVTGTIVKSLEEAFELIYTDNA